jgi:hypothetical protein
MVFWICCKQFNQWPNGLRGAGSQLTRTAPLAQLQLRLQLSRMAGCASAEGLAKMSHRVNYFGIINLRDILGMLSR